MPAIFTVDPSSGVPIYLQVIEQVKRAVVLGALAPGEQLPTVKALAVELTVNPNTVARAYRDLEREAIIETSPGRGSFVRTDGSVSDAREALDDVVLRGLSAAIREAKSLGVDRPALEALVVKALDRWYSATHQKEDS